jgi:hypothetical protein
MTAEPIAMGAGIVLVDGFLDDRLGETTDYVLGTCAADEAIAAVWLLAMNIALSASDYAQGDDDHPNVGTRYTEIVLEMNVFTAGKMRWGQRRRAEDHNRAFAAFGNSVREQVFARETDASAQEVQATFEITGVNGSIIFLVAAVAFTSALVTLEAKVKNVTVDTVLDRYRMKLAAGMHAGSDE